MSWESLDRTRDEYKKKVDDDEKLLATVISRLLRNKKILKQAEERAQKKALCLASDMEAAGETEMAQEMDCPASSIGMEFSPAMWATMGLIDASVAGHGTSEGAVGSS
jgi:hypothetical protein